MNIKIELPPESIDKLLQAFNTADPSLLHSLSRMLESSLEPNREKQTESQRGNDIFIVHGHDEATKQAVSRFVENLGLKAIVLQEQPSAGKTIIEKFESYSDVDFAIVLLTPDDIVAPKSKSSRGKPPARQNVIFELGYFAGKIGRDRVCLIYKEGVEIPTDYEGVVFIKLDANDGWKWHLTKELKSAGFSVNV